MGWKGVGGRMKRILFEGHEVEVGLNPSNQIAETVLDCILDAAEKSGTLTILGDEE